MGFVFSKCSESVYMTNMDDNERYRNLILRSLLKINFGNRMNRCQDVENWLNLFNQSFKEKELKQIREILGIDMQH